VDIIDRIVGGINESVNRITGMSPNSVTFDNAEQLMQKLYKDNEVDVRSPKFNENDIVRISKEKGIFGKGYHPNYTNELFRIRAVKPTQPPHYKIEDLEGELIKGVFYEEELVLTKQQKQEDGDNNSQHRTAHILETRIDNKGIKEHLVKWEGLTDKHNSWVKDTDIVG
jgi:hypothetical protein